MGAQLSRLLKNYLRCHCCVNNSLVRESDQNAHLQLVKSSATPTVFRLFLWGRHRYCIGCLAYVFQRPASAARNPLEARSRLLAQQFTRQAVGQPVG
ncbi:hypothetical protein ACNJYG_03850, partial [Pseudomonas sp. GW6]